MDPTILFMNNVSFKTPTTMGVIVFKEDGEVEGSGIGGNALSVIPDLSDLAIVRKWLEDHTPEKYTLVFENWPEPAGKPEEAPTRTKKVIRPEPRDEQSSAEE